MKTIKFNELKIGDVVRQTLGDETPFDTMVVVAKSIGCNTVTFFRPYVKLEEFTYGDSDSQTEKVLHYIGMDTFTCPLNDISIFVFLGNIYTPNLT